MEKCKIDCEAFYSNYFGHPPEQLRSLLEHRPSNRPTLFLVGDSTLDNKYWLPRHSEKHPDAYIRSRFEPPDDAEEHSAQCTLARDVAYWLSTACPSYTVMNCAVEQSILRTRVSGALLEHDELVRDHISPGDILVVSVGGNDVALSPTLATAAAVFANSQFGGSVGIATLTSLFRDQMQRYVSQLVLKQKPSLIVLCMVYFLDEDAKHPSWASLALKILGYNSNPAKLQATMRKVYEEALCNIRIDGCKVAYAPLFEALDGKTTEHYVDRVEPSELGGQVMANFLKGVIDDAL